MMSIRVPALILLLSFLSVALAQTTVPAWIQSAGDVGARSHAMGFTLPSKPSSMFVMNGQLTSDSFGLQVYADVKRSDDQGNTWTTVGDNTPFKRYGAAAATTGNGDQVLVSGGFDETNGLTTDVWSNTGSFAAADWTQQSSNQFSPARMFHCMVTYNQASVLIFGGMTIDENGNSAAIMDSYYSNNAGLTFIRQASPEWGANGGRYGMSCGGDSLGFVYMVGGSAGAVNGFEEMALSEAFFTINNGQSWSQLTNAPTFTARFHAGPLIVMSDRFMITGGRTTDGSLLSDTWTSPKVSAGLNSVWTRDASSDNAYTPVMGHSTMVITSPINSAETPVIVAGDRLVNGALAEQSDSWYLGTTVVSGNPSSTGSGSTVASSTAAPASASSSSASVPVASSSSGASSASSSSAAPAASSTGVAPSTSSSSGAVAPSQSSSSGSVAPVQSSTGSVAPSQSSSSAASSSSTSSSSGSITPVTSSTAAASTSTGSVAASSSGSSTPSTSSTGSTPAASSTASTPAGSSSAAPAASSTGSPAAASSTASTPAASSTGTTPATSSTGSSPAASSTASTPAASSTASPAAGSSTASTPVASSTASTPAGSSTAQASTSTGASTPASSSAGVSTSTGASTSTGSSTTTGSNTGAGSGTGAGNTSTGTTTTTSSSSSTPSTQQSSSTGNGASTSTASTNTQSSSSGASTSTSSSGSPSASPAVSSSASPDNSGSSSSGSASQTSTGLIGSTGNNAAGNGGSTGGNTNTDMLNSASGLQYNMLAMIVAAVLAVLAM